jgi:hypothetical protein
VLLAVKISANFFSEFLIKIQFEKFCGIFRSKKIFWISFARAKPSSLEILYFGVP